RNTARVTAPLGIGAGQLAPRLTRFLERYSELCVELMLSDRVVDLVEEGLKAPIEATASLETFACVSPGALFRLRCIRLGGFFQRERVFDLVNCRRSLPHPRPRRENSSRLN
ncbi:MAG: hypothetical protein ACLQU2_33115, partial [Candidatus Binataceae bacterium]